LHLPINAEHETGQAASTIFQVFGMARPGIEPNLQALVVCAQPTWEKFPIIINSNLADSEIKCTATKNHKILTRTAKLHRSNQKTQKCRNLTHKKTTRISHMIQRCLYTCWFGKFNLTNTIFNTYSLLTSAGSA